MERRSASFKTVADGPDAGARHPVGLRPRALSAGQESLFFAVIFALGVALQIAAVLLHANASG
jgi:hypothetical protein